MNCYNNNMMMSKLVSYASAASLLELCAMLYTYIINNRQVYIVFRQTPFKVDAWWDPFDAYRVYNGATAILETVYTFASHYSLSSNQQKTTTLYYYGQVVEKTTTGGQTSRQQPYRSDGHESVKRILTTQSRDVVNILYTQVQYAVSVLKVKITKYTPL